MAPNLEESLDNICEMDEECGGEEEEEGIWEEEKDEKDNVQVKVSDKCVTSSNEDSK